MQRLPAPSSKPPLTLRCVASLASVQCNFIFPIKVNTTSSTSMAERLQQPRKTCGKTSLSRKQKMDSALFWKAALTTWDISPSRAPVQSKPSPRPSSATAISPWQSFWNRRSSTANKGLRSEPTLPAIGIWWRRLVVFRISSD